MYGELPVLNRLSHEGGCMTFRCCVDGIIGKGDNFQVAYELYDTTHPYALLFAHVDGELATHQVRIRLSAEQVRALIDRLQGALDANVS